MLPTGHLAAGYLVTKFTIQTLIPAFPQANQPIFWAVGILSSVVTDLDMFYLFYKVGKAISSTAQTNHRVFISHAPLIYLLVSVLGLTLGLILKNSNLQVLAILYFTGVTTHFILDSLRFGIMWLWPFKKRLYAFTGAGVETRPQSEKFLEYWTQFIKIYAKTPIFYLESILVLLAIYIILI